MSKLYTFEDMRRSCRHCWIAEDVIGRQSAPLCKHPENSVEGHTVGHCDESTCPVLRAILDDGEEWE